MKNIFSLINLFYKLASDEDFVTLYHINKHNTGRPQTSRKGAPWKRNWLSEPVESGIFLTDNPAEVWVNHGVKGTVHVYKVSKKIITKSGGLNHFDGANEVLISEENWNEGLREGDVIYLGEMSERKLHDKINEIRREEMIRLHTQNSSYDLSSTWEDKFIEKIRIDDNFDWKFVIRITTDHKKLISLKNKIENFISNQSLDSPSTANKLREVVEFINQKI
jgi:hypothetical protein